MSLFLSFVSEKALCPYFVFMEETNIAFEWEFRDLDTRLFSNFMHQFEWNVNETESEQKWANKRAYWQSSQQIIIFLSFKATYEYLSYNA